MTTLLSKVDQLQAVVTALAKNPPKLKDWISESEAMELTGYNRTTLYKLRKEMRIIGISTGGQKGVMYRLSSIQKWFDKKEDELFNTAINR